LAQVVQEILSILPFSLPQVCFANFVKVHGTHASAQTRTRSDPSLLPGKF